MELISIGKIKANPNNPRVLKNNKYKLLVNSIKEFPEMLNIRPIVVNSDLVVLGGNMRLRACKAAGLKEVPVIIADTLSAEQQNEFIIKDNVGFGEWDWDILANEWDNKLLEEWGLDLKTDSYYDNEGEHGKLTDSFVVPPFTILDTSASVILDGFVSTLSS